MAGQPRLSGCRLVDELGSPLGLATRVDDVAGTELLEKNDENLQSCGCSNVSLCALSCCSHCSFLKILPSGSLGDL